MRRRPEQVLMDGSVLEATSGDSEGSTLTRIMGMSIFASLIEGFVGGGAAGGGGMNNAVMGSIRLFILGTIIETGRRFFHWAVERFKLFRKLLFVRVLFIIFNCIQNIRSLHSSRKETRHTSGLYCSL